MIQRWKQRFSHQLYDTNYGLSESTGPGCVHLGMENIHKVGAIGVLGFNWEVRIVDEHDKEVSRGKVGELIVRGPGVMTGYYKNPEASEQVLKKGWLYTGDMARMDKDGFIYLVDRKKDVVISGGGNIRKNMRSKACKVIYILCSILRRWVPNCRITIIKSMTFK